MAPLARFRLGQRAVALSALSHLADSTPHAIAGIVASAYHALMDGRLDEARQHFDVIRASSFQDPEGFFLGANIAALAGAPADALSLLETAVDGGFIGPANLREDAAWNSIREHPAFERLQQQSDAGLLRTTEMFRAAGGAALLTAVSTSTGGGWRAPGGLDSPEDEGGMDSGAV